MWEIIFTYLLQKGGIFGVLFAISTAWILYRENHFSKTDRVSEKDLKRIYDAISDIKSIQKEIADSVNDIEDTTSTNLSKNTHITEKIDSVKETVIKLDGKSIELDRKIDDLWQWHAVKDSEGVPIWYVRKSLEDSIKNLQQSVEELQVGLIKVNSDLEDKLKKSNDSRINELKKVLESYNKSVTDLLVTLEKIKSVLYANSEEKNV